MHTYFLINFLVYFDEKESEIFSPEFIDHPLHQLQL